MSATDTREVVKVGPTGKVHVRRDASPQGRNRTRCGLSLLQHSVEDDVIGGVLPSNRCRKCLQGSPRGRGAASAAERLTEDLRQHADVVRGHDAIHPDRDVCGGVGGCALMRAEHDAEETFIDTIKRAARKGHALQVTA